ncbi:MAG: ankyrin repeat domain-containing protein [Planctomycetota bacterium]
MSTIGGNWKEMFTAAGNGDLELTSYHLQCGVDPNYQHPEVLTTALIEAAQNGHVEVVKLLLQYGADPKILSLLDGWTALEAAKQTGHDAVIVVLREALGLPAPKPPSPRESRQGLFQRLRSWLGG